MASTQKIDITADVLVACGVSIVPSDIETIIRERLDEMVDALDSFGRLEELVRTAGRGAYAHAEFMIDEMG